MKIKSVLVGICLAGVLVACGPKDADIQKAIDEKMVAFPGVEATVSKGVATITGTCKDEALKENVATALRSIRGVESVINNCELSAPEPEMAPVTVNSDATLTTSVNEVIKAYQGVSATIVDGVVTLSGTLSKDKVPTLIQSIQELQPKKVENKLTIK